MVARPFFCMNYGEHGDRIWTIGIANHVQTTVWKKSSFCDLFLGRQHALNL